MQNKLRVTSYYRMIKVMQTNRNLNTMVYGKLFFLFNGIRKRLKIS